MKTEDKKVEESIIKLKKEKVEVKVNANQYIVDNAISQLKILEEQLKNTSLLEQEKKTLEDSKKLLDEIVSNNSNKFIEGYLVPLKYGDLMTVKADIFDAMRSGEEYDLSDNAKLYAVMMHERTMTVYISLRKKEDITKKYFNNREEVAVLPNSVISEIYSLYVKELVLTEEERKNS